MKKIITTFLFLVLLFSACCKKDEIIACFTVTNPIISLGDTLKLNICNNYSATQYSWDMGDGTTYKIGNSTPPKHIYTAKGTYTIKATYYEHHDTPTLCKQRTATQEQSITVQ